MNRESIKIADILRKGAAGIAMLALLISGANLLSSNTPQGGGFSTWQTAVADPTGPTGPGGGGSSDFGGQFSPPSIPSSLPDYNGGRGYPGLDQSGGVNIYNTQGQTAPNQGGNNSPPNQRPEGLQPGQNPDGSWQRAANGEQIPQYTAPPQFTGVQSIPNVAPSQPPPQQSAGDGNQGQQPPSQQPSESPPQDQEQQSLLKQCETAAEFYGVLGEFLAVAAGGAGSVLSGPSRFWQAAAVCNICNQQSVPQPQPQPLQPQQPQQPELQPQQPQPQQPQPQPKPQEPQQLVKRMPEDPPCIGLD